MADKDSMVTFKIGKDEALVLFELLVEFFDEPAVLVKDNADRIALSRLGGSLEKTLVEPFMPHLQERDRQCAKAVDRGMRFDQRGSPEVIRAKIKSMEITEAPNLDPAKYAPVDFEDFGCTFGLTIGPATGLGGELFYLTVCSPNWLAKVCDKEGFLWGRHHLIVPEYNLRTISGIITKFVEQCSGESWNEVAMKLSRTASWEFEDHLP